MHVCNENNHSRSRTLRLCGILWSALTVPERTLAAVRDELDGKCARHSAHTRARARTECKVCVCVCMAGLEADRLYNWVL